MEPSIATYKIPRFKRGDTFLSRKIATLNRGVEPFVEPMRVYRACMELRTSGGELIHRWATDDEPPTATITGDDLNAVTLHAVEADVTSGWPLGNHVYDLSVWLEPETSKVTIMEGTMEIRRQITANA